MKICSRCKKEKKEDQFRLRKNIKSGLQSWCKDCEKKYQNSYKRKADRKKWENERKRKIRKIIEDAKNKPCKDCEKKYPTYVMTFDHVIGKKEFGIATAICHPSRSFEKLIEEIKKCEVVCMNCHALRHKGKFGPNEKQF